MVVGLGIDLVELDRVGQALARWGGRFLSKLMDPEEAAALPAAAEARVLAVAHAVGGKEAASKALGTGWSRGVQWRHVIVDPLRLEAKLVGRAAAVARSLGAQSRGPLRLERRGNLVLAEFRLLGRP